MPIFKNGQYEITCEFECFKESWGVALFVFKAGYSSEKAYREYPNDQWRISQVRLSGQNLSDFLDLNLRPHEWGRALYHYAVHTISAW